MGVDYFCQFSFDKSWTHLFDVGEVITNVVNTVYAHVVCEHHFELVCSRNFLVSNEEHGAKPKLDTETACMNNNPTTFSYSLINSMGLNSFSSLFFSGNTWRVKGIIFSLYHSRARDKNHILIYD